MMSEFQHYEWLALDRPLNAAQLAEVKRLSSHMDRVTSTNASVSYSYGDFKHDPLDVLARYFDVFFYHANWGTKTVAFRFSSDVIKRAAIEPYLIKHCVELEQRRDFWILSITLETENDYAWIREEDEAASAADIAGVRRQIAQGDYRALYLMWLAKIQEHHDEFSDDEDYDEDYESEEDIGEAPPLPADLKNLDAALNRFCKFFAIDANLVAAAAQQSAQKKEPSRSEMKAAIASLSRKECDDFLLQLLDDQSSLSDRLRQRLGLTSNAPHTVSKSAEQLLQDARVFAAEGKRRAEAQARAARIKELEALAAREDEIWKEVDRLIAKKTTKSRDDAVHLISELHHLAQHRLTLDVFMARVRDVVERSGRSRALISRLKKSSIDYA